MSLTSVDLPDPLTPVTAVSVPSGIVTSMFFRLFARAPRITISPLSARTPRRVASESTARRAGRRRSATRWPFSSSSSGCTLEDHVPAVLARARTEVDDVVGRANRLLVVLDDDDGVAEIAQARERRQQLAVVALMQADRRLVEHVQHAGEVRADLRGEPDALPFAAGQRRGAAIEREVADADVVQERSRSRISRSTRAAINASRSVSSNASNTSSASLTGRLTYSAMPRPFTRTARLCGLSR